MCPSATLFCVDREKKTPQEQINDAIRRYLFEAVTLVVDPSSLDEQDLARDLKMAKQMIARSKEYLDSLDQFDQELLSELKKKAKNHPALMADQLKPSNPNPNGLNLSPNTEKKCWGKSRLSEDQLDAVVWELAEILGISKDQLESDIVKKNARGKAKHKTLNTLIEQKAHPTKHAGESCACGGTLCKTNEERTHKVLHRSKQAYYTRVQILEVLRCPDCNERIVTSPDIGPGEENGYAAEVRAEFAFAAANGIPENRIATMLRDQSVNVPRKDINLSNQSFGAEVQPVIDAMRLEIANSHTIQTDGTGFQVNEVAHIAEQPDYQVGQKKDPEDRANSECTIQVGCNAEQEVAAIIFQLDQKHPGEHLEDTLALRTNLQKPIIMADMAINTIDTAEYKFARKSKSSRPYNRAGCLDHVVVKFENLEKNFPIAKEFLCTLSEIYLADRFFKEQIKVTPEQRQQHHDSFSLPRMMKLRQLANDLLEGHSGYQKVEPNSALGKELKYFLKHFEEFILFCQIAGCPLSNIKSETGNKRIILLRKTCMFYQTLISAQCHANIVSLAATTRILGLNVYGYLLDLMKNIREVKRHPERWTPQAYLRRVIAESADPNRLSDLYRSPPKESQYA